MSVKLDCATGLDDRWQGARVERAILRAAGELLAERNLHSLTASAIMERAGVSRPTFYSYFPSKYAVVARLLSEVFNEIFEQVSPWLVAEVDEGAELVLRDVLVRAAQTLQAHSPIFQAVHENAHAAPELAEAWSAIIDRFRAALSEQISAIRIVQGRSPDDAERLATALVWASERIFYLSTRGIDEAVSTSTEAVDALLMIWVPSIYGTSDRSGDATSGG